MSARQPPHTEAIELDLAARILGRTAERVREIARGATSHCLVLEGPPTVLLDVAGLAETEAAE